MITTHHCSLILGGSLLALGLQAQDQPPVTGHYLPGLEGIRAGSTPPAGLYLRDYNYFYTSENFRSSGVASNFKTWEYAQAPRLMWITGWKPLGFSYGLDIFVPFVYTWTRTADLRDSKFGMGDIWVEPALFSRSFKSFDITAGYAFFAPTGEFDPTRLVSPGKGYWGHMLSLGGTYYFDKNKTFALSALDRYEINQEQDITHLTPGQQNTLEAGLSLAVAKTVDLGLIGYYVQQTTEEKGSGSSNKRDWVVGAGPEINIAWPSMAAFTSLRYAYEIDAQHRPQGHTACLTVTIRF